MLFFFFYFPPHHIPQLFAHFSLCLVSPAGREERPQHLQMATWRRAVLSARWLLPAGLGAGGVRGQGGLLQGAHTQPAPGGLWPLAILVLVVLHHGFLAIPFNGIYPQLHRISSLDPSILIIRKLPFPLKVESSCPGFLQHPVLSI